MDSGQILREARDHCVAVELIPGSGLVLRRRVYSLTVGLYSLNMTLLPAMMWPLLRQLQNTDRDRIWAAVKHPEIQNNIHSMVFENPAAVFTVVSTRLITVSRKQFSGFLGLGYIFRPDLVRFWLDWDYKSNLYCKVCDLKPNNKAKSKWFIFFFLKGFHQPQCCSLETTEISSRLHFGCFFSKYPEWNLKHSSLIRGL